MNLRQRPLHLFQQVQSERRVAVHNVVSRIGVVVLKSSDHEATHIFALDGRQYEPTSWMVQVSHVEHAVLEGDPDAVFVQGQVIVVELGEPGLRFRRCAGQGGWSGLS